jgi:hypothetical protein
MSRWIFFLFFFLTVFSAPLRAAQNIVLLPATAVADKIPIDDIEPPFAPPLPLPERILRFGRESSWLRPALAAALLAVIILLFFLRWKKQPPQQNDLPPAETARLSLAQAEQLIAAGDCAAFAELFEHTLRRYLEAGLGMAALQQTVSELISQLHKEEQGLPKMLQAYGEEAANWLRTCEAGKFAGASLSQEEMSEMTTQLRGFIAAAEERAPRNTDGQLSLR